MSNHWYKFYPGDFSRDTSDLSLEEEGAYRRLIDHYMMTGQPIPDDIHRIRRVLKGISLQKTRKIWRVLSRFFDEKNGVFYHKKCEENLRKSLKISETQSAKAYARWHPESMPPETRNQNVKETSPVGDAKKSSNGRFKPPTIEQIQSYIDEKNYNVDAERFFNFYESKGWMVGKTKMRKWKAAVANWNKSNNQPRANHDRPTKAQQHFDAICNLRDD